MSAAPHLAQLLAERTTPPPELRRYFVGKIELLGNSYPCQFFSAASSVADFVRTLDLLVLMRSPQRIPVEIFYDGKWCSRRISPRLARRLLTLVACAR